MAPVTRSQQQSTIPGSRVDGPEDLDGLDAHDSNSSTDSNATSDEDADSDDADSEDDDDDDGPVQSPLTRLLYTIDHLDDETQEMVRELFRPPPPDETPPLTVAWCGVSNDPDVYAFQLHERVPRAIRIGSPTSRFPRPSCNCTGAALRPCRHLVWLMDQIAQHTLPRHPPTHPLVLNTSGFPREFDGEGEDESADSAESTGISAYERIRAFHIDILANALHCRAGPPTAATATTGATTGGRGGHGRGRQPWPDRHRVREVREILAGLAGVQDDAGVDAYAPEIFDGGPEETFEGRRSRTGGVRSLVERGDLQRTLARLLAANGTIFALFLQLLAPHDKARDPFRKIQQRVEAVLDALRRRRRQARPRAETETAGAENDGVSVAWAAQHVTDAVEQIRLLLEQQQQRETVSSWARQSASRALVWILHALVSRHNEDVHAGATQDDRNLYQRLIGNNHGSADGGRFFLLDELDSCLALHDADADAGDGQALVRQRRQLERIRHRIQRNGYREPYLRRLDDVLARMRQQAEAEAATAAEEEAEKAAPVVAGRKRQQASIDAEAESSRGPKRVR